MAEFPCQPESTNRRLQSILDLLSSAGYADAHKPDITAPEKLAGGLAWCVAALNSPNSQIDVVVSSETLPHEDNKKEIEEALRSLKCPHSLEASQIRNLDCESIFPVVQWLLERVRDGKDENQRKVGVVSQLQQLRERISMEGAETKVQKFASLMQSLKDMEKKESEFLSYSGAKRYQLEAEVIYLKEKIAGGCDSKSLSDGLDRSLSESAEELNSARKELAATLRAILAVKRQLDDVPSQSELIQYERRLSDLYGHIQGKHQQTQKHYDTYNALLEIKELMLKETSLLNSISSQFQNAITSTAGRMKLIDSMEGIVKGSQQKLQKVRLGLEEQEKIRDALKERYTAAIAAQRQWYSLLKAFQEACAKNERLRSSTSV
ncbi:hypothetical protein L484_002524 [Morus notabilis]|uniref:Uncharacterized protein n=1 Tax=Morus notabilis TaxID=981085 RepID=W9SY13_9ROSA|nr:coiled-coil domain-containing protein 93 [Morus notabilis]EXC32578.1 hypothetical protein L484_002524 [Morus notabilis]